MTIEYRHKIRNNTLEIVLNVSYSSFLNFKCIVSSSPYSNEDVFINTHYSPKRSNNTNAILEVSCDSSHHQNVEE